MNHTPLTQHEARRRITAALAPDERTYSVARMLRLAAESGGLFERSSLEAEVAAQAARDSGLAYDPHCFKIPYQNMTRDATVASSAGGGFLVGADAPFEVHPTRPYSVVLQAGVTLLPGLVGNVPVPKLTSDPTAYWLSTEGTQTTQSEMTFGTGELMPKTVGVFVRMSRRLLLQGASADVFVSRALLRAAGRARDYAVLMGSGVNGQPTGIINVPGIGTSSGTSLAWSGIMNARASAVDALGDDRSIKWIGGSQTQQILGGREKFAGAGAMWGWDRALQNGEIAGHSAFATSAAPVDSLFLGDWAECVVGEWGDGIAVEMNPYENFQSGVVSFRVLLSTDVAFTSPAYFSAISSIT